MGLGYDKDGELVEYLAIPPRRGSGRLNVVGTLLRGGKLGSVASTIVDGSIETFQKLFAGLFASYISRNNNIREAI